MPPPSPSNPFSSPDLAAGDLHSLSSSSHTLSASSSSSSSSPRSNPNPNPNPNSLPRLSKPGASIPISDLRFIRRIGSGDIGSVYLAELRLAGGEPTVVAAKVMDKKELIARNKGARARTEREILEMFDHPFLPKLYGCAENERVTSLLTEFCPGGDLHVLRQKQIGKRFDEAAVRFYAAEVVAALEYIHMLGVIYRDLKPENVLVRSDGHVMLTDFDLSLKSHHSPSPHLIRTQPPPISTCTPTPTQTNTNTQTACILPNCIVPTASCFRPNRRRPKKPDRRSGLIFVAEPVGIRSTSFVGTYEYLAPEIVSGEGHGSTVDWWTLGILIYELLFGSTPFKGPDNEQTLANIVARGLEFPKGTMVSAHARELIVGLLVKDPAHRLGSSLGATAIKRHGFFSGVNWALLRCAVPPHVPPVFSIGRDGEEDMDSCPGTPVEYY